MRGGWYVAAAQHEPKRLGLEQFLELVVVLHASAREAVGWRLIADCCVQQYSAVLTTAHLEHAWHNIQHVQQRKHRS